VNVVSLASRALAEARRQGRQARRAALRPPACPADWRTGPPDFVGVGVQKAGTSWWFSLLIAHPDVHYDAALPKELRFFDRFWREPFTPADAVAYARFFPRPPGGVAGEWTPRYLSDYWAPPLLAEAAPDAKILVLVRDPVERYRSGVTHDLQLGAAPHPSTAQHAFERGFYAAQLTRLFTHFPRERVLVLQYERCLADPWPELERTYRFVGVADATWRPGDVDRRVNETKVAKVPLDERLRRELVARYADDVAHLFTLCPELDAALWPNFA
jgi:hypothetical protein